MTDAEGDAVIRRLWYTKGKQDGLAEGRRLERRPKLSEIECQAILDAMDFTERKCGLVSDAHILAKGRITKLQRSLVAARSKRGSKGKGK